MASKRPRMKGIAENMAFNAAKPAASLYGRASASTAPVTPVDPPFAPSPPVAGCFSVLPTTARPTFGALVSASVIPDVHFQASLPLLLSTHEPEPEPEPEPEHYTTGTGRRGIVAVVLYEYEVSTR